MMYDSNHIELHGDEATFVAKASGTIIFSEQLLVNNGARLLRVRDGMTVCEQGEQAKHFYVVKCGKIKMTHFNDEGREFVQGYFTAGHSFGEPPLLATAAYPASAIAVGDSEIWSLDYRQFITLLHEHFEIHFALLEILSKRLLYKSMMLSEVALEEAEHRLKALLRYFKRVRGLSNDEEFMVPFTRLQLAEMTGLRVETVIRTIRSMEQKGLLEIIQGKVFWTPKNFKQKKTNANNK